MGNAYNKYPFPVARGLPSIVSSKLPTLELLSSPGECFGLMDDFVTGISAVASGTTLAGWIATEVTDGTILASNEFGGGITLTPAATENNGIQVQTGEAFQPKADGEIFFGARVKMSDVLQNDVFIGLTTHDTDVAGSVPNDAIGFKISDAAATILYYAAKDGTGAQGVTTGVSAVENAYYVLC